MRREKPSDLPSGGEVYTGVCLSTSKTPLRGYPQAGSISSKRYKELIRETSTSRLKIKIEKGEWRRPERAEGPLSTRSCAHGATTRLSELESMNEYLS